MWIPPIFLSKSLSGFCVSQNLFERNLQLCWEQVQGDPSGCLLAWHQNKSSVTDSIDRLCILQLFFKFDVSKSWKSTWRVTLYLGGTKLNRPNLSLFQPWNSVLFWFTIAMLLPSSLDPSDYFRCCSGTQRTEHSLACDQTQKVGQARRERRKEQEDNVPKELRRLRQFILTYTVV